MTIPSDPLYSQQWHFGLITNNGSDPSLMERLWDDYSGAGVHVGVYDIGVEYAHPDLNDNYDPTRNVLVDTDGEPSTPPVAHDGNVVGNNGHGTSVAGIIAAEMNGEGTVGIAHGASLTSVNIFDPSSTVVNGTANFFGALHQMTNFDVANHSWGITNSTLFFLDDRNVNVPGSLRARLLAEYEYVVENGRGGLGTVICQAAGNLNVDGGGDSLNASRFTLTVGAILENGFAASYSSYGASLLVSSAGGDRFSSFTTNDVSTVDGTRLITTTDQVGANGGNKVTPDPNSASPPFTIENADFTNRMNGTSAATPMVSGIVALMLEANPDLGWRDVHNILANTAFHTGSSVGSAPGLNENSTWFMNKADGWNGGGMHFSNDYGYGNADAIGAVRLAEAMGVMDAVAQTSANEQTVTTGTVVSGAAIADQTNNSYTFDVAGDLLIEHASVTIDLTHSDFKDLRIFLVSAEGTEVQLYDGVTGTDATADAGFTWTFGIEALRGELSAGTWTLKINDVAGGDAGILNDVKIDVFGSAPSKDDTYHFTDEFSQFAVDPSRLILIDSDGGEDWFDGSTLLSSARIDLNDGATSTVDGEILTIAAGTFIENAILSDGADTVVGNELDNRLYGMRGNDTLKGGGGSDVLDGGKGNDLFYVDNAGDTVVEAAGGGNDRVAAQAGFALGGGQEVERLTTTNSNAVRSIDLRGNELAQTIVGNNGANWLHDGGMGAADALAGRGGNDFYTIYNSGAVVIEGKGQGDFDRLAAGVDYVLAQGVEIESLRTTGQHATYGINLTGNEFSQQIIGNDGDNRIDGKGGSDTILTGLGNDTIVFSTALGGAIDKITDFDTAGDQIELDDAIFSVIGLGMLAASAFKDNATSARDADDHIIYNSNTGSLFYDVDGVGGAAAVKFAWLATGLSLSAADFIVI